MERIKLNLDKSKKYVIACSFGPDSMALLSAALNEKLNVVVAHVNYRKRDAAVIEQASLEKYCEAHDIKIYVLDLLHKKATGNFQDWARKQRYEFFKKVAEKESAEAVLVAHQQDDVIETYLMQKKRGNFVKNYGISGENEIFGVKIIRPLLSYSKLELKDYDDIHGVPYSIDESNLSNDYERNKIRHTIVEKMSLEERKALVGEIQNKKNKSFTIKSSFTKDEFLGLDYEEIVQLISFYMEKVNEHKDISLKYVNEIKKAFVTKTNLQINITESLMLELDYGEVVFVNKKRLNEYTHLVKSKLETEIFDIDFSGGAEDRGIENLDDEFIVKNCSKNDKLIIKDYSSSIRRLFIDWKMPLYLREVWPGIYDKNGKLLYVPRYRKVFKDEHKSKFKIKIDYFTSF